MFHENLWNGPHASGAQVLRLLPPTRAAQTGAPCSCPHRTALGSALLTCLLSLFVVVQSLSHVQLFVTPWTAACQASLSITNSWSLLKLMSIELVMPFNHLILCHLLLLLPSVFLSIRVFSNKSVLRIRWPKYWSFSFSIGPSNERIFRVDFLWD